MMSTGHTNAGKATGKAGAYGCSELGSQIGGAVGPPVIGSLVGTLVGEMIGEKTMDKTGVNDMVSKAGDKLVPVIGRRNVNKLGDMTMTAFGYGDSEVCVCCPCLPASQVLLVVTIPFFFFNLIKFGLGVTHEVNCSTAIPPNPPTNYNTDSYPCVYGFEYLILSSLLWLCFLPLWIPALFGNCWRQCFCCFCDPIVLLGTIIDFVKRCCCEFGRFNLCEFVWYSHCAVHLVLAVTGLVWLACQHQAVSTTVWLTVLLSIGLDFLLAGSEIFHRARLHQIRKAAGLNEMTEESPLLYEDGWV